MWPLSQIKPYTNVAPITNKTLYKCGPYHKKNCTNETLHQCDPYPHKAFTNVILSPKTQYQCGPHPQKTLYHCDPYHKKNCTIETLHRCGPYPPKPFTNMALIYKTLYQYGPYLQKPSTDVAPVPKNLAPMCPIPKTLYTESLYQSFTFPLLFIFSLITDVI